MTAMEQQFAGIQIGVDYPLPLVDLAVSSKAAKDKIWGHRKIGLVREESKRIVKKHTRQGKTLAKKKIPKS
jgi:deoxyribodipyrimidine photo-lyase